MIGGTGSLASLTAESGGVVSPGDGVNPFGTLTVAGNLNFKPGSFLWIRSSVNGGAYSRLNVGGATRLEGGQVVLKADSGEWNLRSRMNIIQSTGAVTGAFTGAQSDLAFLTPVLTYSTNGVTLTVRRNDVTVASLGANSNQKSAGAALDVMINGSATGGSRDLSLENALLDASVPAVQAALPSLTGEVHASLAGLAVSDTRAIREAMSDRGRGQAGGQTYAGNGVSVWGSGVFGDGRGSRHDGLAAFRQGAGPDMGILLDTNFNFKTEGYIKVARACEPYNLFWMEIDSYDPEGLRLIRDRASMPIASCESLFGRRQFRPFFENRSIDVSIIDVPWNGLMESLKVAAMAEAYEINCAPHNFYGHMSTLMSAHLCAAMPNFRIMEIDIDDVPWKDDLVTHPPVIQNGELIVPTRPGWGADINEEAVRAHPPRNPHP